MKILIKIAAAVCTTMTAGWSKIRSASAQRCSAFPTKGSTTAQFARAAIANTASKTAELSTAITSNNEAAATSPAEGP